MAEWVVFGTGSPGAPNETDGPIALATGFTINDGGTYWCTGVEFFASSVAPTGVEVALWERIDDSTPGSQLAVEPAPGAITPAVRNRIMFDTPVVVTAASFPNGLYAVMRTANRYVATSGYFDVPDISGPITAYANGVGGFGPNGRFNVGAAGADYPNNTFLAGGYWVSPIVTDVDPGGATDLEVTDGGPRGARAGGSPALAAADHVVADVSGGLQAGGSPAGVVADHIIPDGGPRGARAGGSAAEAEAGTADVTVTDRPGGALAGGSPATVTAASASIADTAVWPMLVQVLACLEAAADEVEAPPFYRSIRMGEGLQANISPSEDECCQGLAWVRPVQISPTNTFPTPESAWSPCPPGELAVEIEIGMLRCAPIMAPGGDDAMLIPTAAQHAQTAYRVLADAAALRRAACCLINQGYSVFVGSWSPVPVEANCAGGSMRITVAVPFCERTC